MSNMANVTLGYEDVEWFDMTFEELKDASFDDARFDAYVQVHGLLNALDDISRFHRIIANQLIRHAVTDAGSSDWASRTVGLNIQVKRRRNQVRRMFRAEYGQEKLTAFTVKFDGLYPRAVWGAR